MAYEQNAEAVFEDGQLLRVLQWPHFNNVRFTACLKFPLFHRCSGGVFGMQILAETRNDRGIAECLCGQLVARPPSYKVAALPTEVIVPKQGRYVGLQP